MKLKNIVRYIVTDVASIPVVKLGRKGEAYRAATKPGWGTVEWYSSVNNYEMPVYRDRSDKTQELCCNEDNGAVLYSRTMKEFGYGTECVIAPYEKIDLKSMPTQAQTVAIIISDCCGYSFWAKDPGDIKIFVIYDKNGLIDSYRLGGWMEKPYEDETEIAFDDLQSKEEHDTMDRVDIVGTLEYERRMARK